MAKYYGSRGWYDQPDGGDPEEVAESWDDGVIEIETDTLTGHENYYQFESIIDNSQGRKIDFSPAIEIGSVEKTIEFWCNFANISVIQYGGMVGFRLWDDNSHYIILDMSRHSSEQWEVYTNATRYQVSTIANSGIAVNTWFKQKIIFKTDDTIEWYLDGSLFATISAANNTLENIWRVAFQAVSGYDHESRWGPVGFSWDDDYSVGDIDKTFPVSSIGGFVPKFIFDDIRLIDIVKIGDITL